MTGILSLLLCLSLWLSSTHAQTLTQAPVNWSAPTARGLIAWWRAVPGTTGGTRFYDLLGREAMTLVNTTTRVSTERLGGAGHIPFNGTNAYGESPSSPRFFPAIQTLMLWFKRTATGGTTQTLIGTTPGGHRQLYVKASGALAYAVEFSTGFFSGDFTGPTLAIGPWYHVTMLISPTGGFIVYVNCRVQQAFGADGSTFVAVTKAVTIGAESSGTQDYLTGAIDDVRIYNRAVPQGELCTIVSEAQRGDPVLLRPPLVALGLASVGIAPSGIRGNFFPFFGQP
jgi:hypothetical protein